MAAPTFRNKLRVPDVLPSPDAACSDPRTLDLARPRQRDARGCQAGVREKTGAASRWRDHVSRWAPSSERPRPSEASSSPSSPRPVSLRCSALAGRRGLWWGDGHGGRSLRELCQAETGADFKQPCDRSRPDSGVSLSVARLPPANANHRTRHRNSHCSVLRW